MKILRKILRYPAVLLGLFLLFAGFCSSLDAKNRTQPMLVTPEWLRSHMNDPALVLLHVGDKAGYEAGHIPGAQHISLADISKPRGEGLSLELPSVENLKQAFERFGVSNHSKIVLYFGKDWMSPTSRVYWTLDYLGLSIRTSILDGGMPAWQKAGGEITTTVPTVARGSLTPHTRNDVLVDCNWVKRHLNSKKVAIIDSRDAEFYDGRDAGMMPRAGHIPGATSLPFTALADSSNRMRSLEDLKVLFNNAGATQGDTVVTYCHIGQQATLGYFAARMLGYEARLYDGSFDEWSKNPDLQVENLKQPDAKK